MTAMAAPPALLTSAARWARGRQAAVIAVLLSAAALVDPDQPLTFDLCLWRRLTGLPCLTCGLTRSVCHAIRGDWSASVALHPAGVLLLAGLAGWGLWSAIEAGRGRAILSDVRSLAGVSLLRAGLAASAFVWAVRLVSGASV